MNLLPLSTLMVATLAVMNGSSSAQATVIAVIDSGTDLGHSQLVQKKWTNLKDVDDAVDNDDNGYIDDVHGWNFADSNNKLFDRKLVGTFSKDVYKFFEVQNRMLKGEATEEDRQWMAAARNNSELIAELGVFGNFVHGTHVAGIAAQNADAAQVMGLKIIPTKSPIRRGKLVGNFAGRSAEQWSNALTVEGSDKTEKLLKQGLKLLAAQQGKTLAPVGAYVAKQKARIANCSFGTSTRAATQIVGPLLKLILKREPTEAEILDYSSFFVSEVVKSASNLIEPSKGKTLFVIAAGNDGMDNDVYPTSPANYKSNHVITVAATHGYQKLASFSNFGKSKVEVAAPGVGIVSSIPGEETLMVSGTSQAAPFVANVMGKMLDANPALSNSDLRKVMMETSDVKAFLKGKVSSEGIVNLGRAVLAAKLSKSGQLSDAIASSRLQINDVSVDAFHDLSEEGFVMPMPELFQ
jgi:cell wall-associated protease